jgi:glycosyltransferase involved in cell wall biosynthesis
MRILTIGAKPAINNGLALIDELQVVALSHIPAAGVLPYQQFEYARGKKLSWRSIRQVRDAICRHQPDLIHAFYPRPLAHTILAAMSLRSRVPIVSYRGVTAVPKAWSPDQWISYLSPRVAAHGCESASVAAALHTAGIPAKRCHVVHNCLNHPPALLARDSARRRLGVDQQAFVVIMVANMRPVKGADVLLTAALECEDLARARFVLVGRALDPAIDRLVRHPRLAGRVVLAGYRPDASRLVGAADLFVMPSRAEALSVALLEGMSAGVCPVVSDAGGMKEAVRHNQDGIVFPSENSAALASAIRMLHDDPVRRAAFGRSARERAENHFSAEATASRLTAMYQTVLGDGGGGERLARLAGAITGIR